MGVQLSKRKSYSFTTEVVESGDNIRCETQVVPDDSKFIQDGPIRSPLFVPTIPTSITRTKKKKLKGDAWSIWRTPLENVTMVAGCTEPSVWVINDQYKVTEHKLSRGKIVCSGVCVSAETSIVLVEDAPLDSLYTVSIDVTSRILTTADPVNTFEVREPVYVFRFDKHKYGVMCKNPSRIEVFTLRDILLEETIKTNQTIRISLPQGDFSQSDKACVTPDYNVCILSWENGGIYVFTEHGDFLYTIGEERGWDDHVDAGMLLRPVSVQCGDDGRLLVCGVYGDIHMYDNGDWTLVKNKHSNIWDSVVTDTKLLTVCGRKLKVYNIEQG